MFLAPARQAALFLMFPVVRPLAMLQIPPNAISSLQLVGTVVFLLTVRDWPHFALGIFFATLVADGLDGALARHTGRSSRFGAIYDQFCDHVREVTVVLGLAAYGAVDPLWAGAYGFVYPVFNLTLLLCNYYRAPLQFVVKSYLLFYPALLAFLWWGNNWLTPAVSLSVVFMSLAVIMGLFRLRATMDRATDLAS